MNPPARQLYLVRHGQCEFNAEGRVAGQLDSSLTVLGFEQAGSAAERLADSGARYLFTSDLGRAVQTAEVIGRRLGLEPRLDPDLREQHLGDMQGRLTRDLHALESPAGVHINSVRWGGGESIVDLYGRVARFFGRLAGLPPGPAIIVSHEHTIHVADAYLRGAGPLDIDWAELPNGGILTRVLAA